jgi:uncharacterized protein YbjT (DUF2867 family)
MNSNALHVVFGTGQVGSALVEHLSGLGVEVRAVSRHRPVGLSQDIDWMSADAANPESATDAAKGATVIYQCLNLVHGVADPVPAAAARRVDGS